MTRNNTKSNFGKWGWSMILYCALIYYFAGGLGNDGLNVYPEAFAALRGWDANIITAFATIGGLTSIPGTIVFSLMTEKKGVRFTAVFGCIATGLATLLFAFAPTFELFLFASVLVQFLTGSIFVSIVPNFIMNSWFPVKKGLALGWASMGLPLCTATFVAIMMGLIGAVGPSIAYAVIAIIVILLGVLSHFWVKNKPEDVGIAPDNVALSVEELAASKTQMELQGNSLTARDILKDKRAWLIGLGLGLLWMVTVGIVSRLIPRLMSLGYEQTTALGMLTIASLCGIVGSYVWGWLDQKLGTRKTSIIYGLWYIIALALLIVENNSVATMAAVIFAGIGIGGIGNLVPSMIGTVYGRKNYLAANRVVMPLCSIVRSCAFALMTFTLTTMGGYTGAYSVFIGACVLGMILIWLVGKDGDNPIDA